MAKQTINIGASPNDGSGDQLRDAFDKTNDNFDELYGFINQDSSDNIIINPDNSNARVVIVSDNVPTAAIGSAGDIAGMIAWDSQYLYLCSGTYNGTTPIWNRTLIQSW